MGIGKDWLLGSISIFGERETRVQVLVRLVGRQRRVLVPHRKKTLLSGIQVETCMENK